MQGDSIPGNATSSSGPPPCKEGCKCKSVKSDVEELGENFPSILVATPEAFFEKAKRNPRGRDVEGTVQLILTDPCEYNYGKCSVRLEYIGNIVSASAKMLKAGGHIFIRTTMFDARPIIQAFRAKMNDVHQSVFTVEDEPILMLMRPEELRQSSGDALTADGRRRIGINGTKTYGVSVLMIHAIKNGAPQTTNPQNCEHTQSLYSAATNVIDGSVEKTGQERGLNLNGATEIVNRYTKGNDTIVDFFSEKGWTAIASVSLKESRIFVGVVSSEEAKNDLETKIADCLIYQTGKKNLTKGMLNDEELKDRMIQVYNDHDYAKWFHPQYGLITWLKVWKTERELPLLTTIPSIVLETIAVKKNNLKFRSRKYVRTPPHDMPNGIGEELARMEAEEPLRSALVADRLYIDGRSPYTKEGLLSVEGGDEGNSLGFISGILLKGDWKENKQALEELGTGLFGFEEYIVKNKYIPIKQSCLITKEGEEELKDLRIIPAKYSPFRYAQFRSGEGNARLRINRDKKIQKEQLQNHLVMEVIQTARIEADEAIVIDITFQIVFT